MWSRADVIGLFSNNVVSFSSNVVLRGLLFSINLVSKPRMLSVRGDYVLSSLQLPDDRVRSRVFEKIPQTVLEHAVDNVDALIRPPEDVFYKELDARYAAVRRYLPAVLNHVRFEASPAGKPVVQAYDWLRDNSHGTSASGGDHKCMAALCLSKRQQRRYSRLHLLHARSTGHRLTPSRCVYQAQLALC